VKYNKPGGNVTLSLDRNDEYAIIQVSDTGVGIRESEQVKVFDRFYRIDKEHSRSMGGTGLGLYIVRWIIETHGGAISLASSEGNGSTFTIHLPLLLR
jgi:two-component system OmpR family sensor kinase